MTTGKIMKKKFINNQLCAIALSTFFAGTANAEITLNGFATIGAGQVLSGNSLYDYDDTIDYKPDSLVGLQVSSDLGNGLGVTTQIISRGSDEWDASFEWAYISYDVNDDWRFLFGRQRAPQKIYSDFVDVGYAYPWITPPRGLYSPSFDSFDGVGSIYNFTLGSYDSNFHVMVGRTADNPFGDDVVDSIDISNFMVGAFTITDGFITARAAVGSRKAEVVIPGIDTVDDQPGLVAQWESLALNPALAATGIDFATIGNDIAINDNTMFYTAALKADFSHGFAVIEWEENDYGDSLLGQSKNWYIAGGVNITTDVIVFATYGESVTEVDSLSSPDQAAGLGLDLLIIGSKAAMSDQLIDEKYYTLGARWNFHDSAALKIEYTQLDDNQVNPYVASDIEADAKLMRLALVTVF
jgi:hypothetical protein